MEQINTEVFMDLTTIKDLWVIADRGMNRSVLVQVISESKVKFSYYTQTELELMKGGYDRKPTTQMKNTIYMVGEYDDLKPHFDKLNSYELEISELNTKRYNLFKSWQADGWINKLK